MTRQVRIDDELARQIEDQYTDLSLSAGANEAIKRGLAAATARAPGSVPPNPASMAAHRGGRCPHPLSERVGTRCALCRREVHRR